MKKKDAGFSLVELIVVIAIIAILSGGVTSLVLSQSRWRCRKAAEQISYAMDETRAQSLAKNKAWMRIKYYADRGYVIETSYAAPVTIGNTCEIKYTDSNGATESIEDNTLILSYARDSGAYLAIISDVTEGTTDYGAKSYAFVYADPLAYCSKITVSKGTGKAYELVLEKETGRHELKSE